MTEEGNSSRTAIVKAATELFAEHGFEGTSTRAIIEASGTSKGSFYHFFASKEDLYATVLENLIDDVWAASFDDPEVQDVDRESFWCAIAHASRRSAEHMLEHPEQMRLWRGFQRSWRLIGDVGPARRLRERKLQMGRQLAELGQRLGCLRIDLTPLECAQLVEALDAIMDGWFFDLADRRGGREAFERHVPLNLDLIWRMLASPDDLRHGRPPFGAGHTPISPTTTARGKGRSKERRK